MAGQLVVQPVPIAGLLCSKPHSKALLYATHFINEILFQQDEVISRS
jgi:hypothetical protein